MPRCRDITIRPGSGNTDRRKHAQNFIRRLVFNQVNLILCLYIHGDMAVCNLRTDDNNRGSLLKENLIVTLQECSGRGPEKALLTLTRGDSAQAWGFSCHGGEDLEHWGGLLSGEYHTNSQNYNCSRCGKYGGISWILLSRRVCEASRERPVAGSGQRQGGLSLWGGGPQTRGLHHQHQWQTRVPPEARGGDQAHQELGTGLILSSVIMNDYEPAVFFRLFFWMLRGMPAKGCCTAMGCTSTALTFSLRKIGNLESQ